MSVIRKKSLIIDNEDFSQKNLNDLCEKIANLDGPITTNSNLGKKLVEFGISEKNFDDLLAIVVENTTLSLQRLLRNILIANIDNVKSKIKPENDKPKEVLVKKLISNHLGEEEFEESKFNVFINEVDYAFIMGKIGGGICGNIIEEKFRYLKDKTNADYIIDDKHKYIEVCNIYLSELNGQKFVLYRYVVSNSFRYTLNVKVGFSEKIGDEIMDFYSKNSLFKNKTCLIGRGPIQFISNEEQDFVMTNGKMFDYISRIVENWDKIGKGNRKQGFLLYGPPGTGKTSFISKLLKKFDGITTNFIITGANIELLTSILSLAHVFGPNIVVFEDIDSIQISRDISIGKNENLSSILNSMDGAKKTDSIIIGTTNYPDHIDKALLRPGRFSTSIEMKLESADRINIIKYYINKYKLPDHIVTNAIEMLDKDFIYGTHIAEIFKLVNIGNSIGEDPSSVLNEAFYHFVENNLNTSTKDGKVGFKND